jgi:hypothetical protein
VRQCPNCPGTYWTGKYCPECGHGSPPTLEEWYAIRETEQFMYIQHQANQRGLLLFSIGCLRRAIHLTKDHRLTSRFHELEKVAEKQLDAVSLVDCEVDADLKTPQGCVDSRLTEAMNNALRGIQFAPIGGIGPDLGLPLHVALCAALHICIAISDYHCPERYWHEHELPPELEQFRGLLHSQQFNYEVGHSPNEHPEAYSAWTILNQAQEQTERKRQQVLAEENKIQCDLYRDLFRYPFQSPSFSPEWRTPNVLAIAQKIYDERTFDGLPILADALEETGCDDTELLTHCRGTNPHIWGCWALDLILGYRDEPDTKSTL